MGIAWSCVCGGVCGWRYSGAVCVGVVELCVCVGGW